MSGSHHHGGGSPLVDLRLQDKFAKSLVLFVVAIGVITLVGFFVLWPSNDVRSTVPEANYEIFKAEIVLVEPKDCDRFIPGAGDITCIDLHFKLLEGPHENRIRYIEFVDARNIPFSEGERIMVEYYEGNALGREYAVRERDRSEPLLGLLLVFSIAVIALARWRGILALVSLGITIVILLGFTVPALVEGGPPIPLALVSAVGIAFLAIYFSHGFNYMSTVALLGTLMSLALTAILSLFFSGFLRITGTSVEGASFFVFGDYPISPQGLILAGVIIGTLGALDDVTVTQSSAVWELRKASPDYSLKDLYQSGLKIGRDHIASTVNTLVLAYAGAALPLFIVFVLTNRALGVTISNEIITTEIFRTLVGSIGLVASVPITTFLAAFFALRSNVTRNVSASEEHEVTVDESDDQNPFVGNPDAKNVSKPHSVSKKKAKRRKKNKNAADNQLS